MHAGASVFRFENYKVIELFALFVNEAPPTSLQFARTPHPSLAAFFPSVLGHSPDLLFPRSARTILSRPISTIFRMALKSDITLNAQLFVPSSIPAATAAFNDKLVQIMSTGPKWYEVPSPSLLSCAFQYPFSCVSRSPCLGWCSKVSGNASRRRDTTT